MKAGDLAKLFGGMNPDAHVYIDLGLCHDKRKEFIKQQILNQDDGCMDIEGIELSVSDDGVFEVYLLPYDGQYGFVDTDGADAFFQEHNLSL